MLVVDSIFFYVIINILQFEESIHKTRIFLHLSLKTRRKSRDCLLVYQLFDIYVINFVIHLILFHKIVFVYSYRLAIIYVYYLPIEMKAVNINLLLQLM